MGKLIFKYGTMGAAKSAEALIKIHYERAKGNKVLTVKPKLDTRDKNIKSRIGLETKVDIYPIGLVDIVIKQPNYDFIIVDEAQFLASVEVDRLRAIADQQKTIVICYGLKSDFRTCLFEGSNALLSLADEIVEIESTCSYCNNKAIFNMRVDKEGNGVLSGNSIQCGGTAKYKPVCSSCYYIYTDQN